MAEESSFGILHVTVHEGKDLKAGDIDGSSDPYAQLTLEFQKVKTPYRDATLNPVWNMVFDLAVTKPHSPLIVEIFDKDIARDDSLGRFEVRLEEYRDKPPVNKWFPVHTSTGVQGQVQLTLQFNTIAFLFEKIKKHEEEEKRLAEALQEKTKDLQKLEHALTNEREKLTQEKAETDRLTKLVAELTTLVETLRRENHDHKEENERIKKERDALAAQLAALQQQFEKSQSENASLLKKDDSLQQQVSKLTEENKKLTSEIERLKANPAKQVGNNSSNLLLLLIAALVIIIGILLGYIYTHQH